MPSKFDQQAADIEATQATLRASIEVTKLLASDAESLIERRQPSRPLANPLPPAS